MVIDISQTTCPPTHCINLYQYATYPVFIFCILKYTFPFEYNKKSPLLNVQTSHAKEPLIKTTHNKRKHCPRILRLVKGSNNASFVF